MQDEKILYFRGCTLAYSQTDVDNLIAKILQEINVPFFVLPNEPCCGGELFRHGAKKQAIEKVKQNWDYFKQNNVKKILTYCPECYVTFKIDYPKIIQDMKLEIIHFTELIASLLKEKKIKFEREIQVSKNLTYFDGCHLGREAKLYEEPRYILQSIPGIKYKEMPLSGKNSLCCGGPIRIPHVDLRNTLVKRTFTEAKKKAKAKGDGGIVMTCPTCYYNFKTVATLTESKTKPISLVRLIAYELGILDTWKDEEEV
ncbi:MAG: (Fe-S)-binding protein [Candidatus Helarchaeota archaeon]